MRIILPLLLLVALAGCSVLERARSNFWELERGPSGQAPDPAFAREAVIQVYAARTVGWRGFFAVHTWISVKPRDAESYTRYEVIGWGVGNGAPAIRVNRTGADNYWFGDRPELLVDVRGEAADPLIARVEAAVASYPYPTSYRTWPGPNSNTFTAWVGRAAGASAQAAVDRDRQGFPTRRDRGYDAERHGRAALALRAHRPCGRLGRRHRGESAHAQLWARG